MPAHTDAPSLPLRPLAPATQGRLARNQRLLIDGQWREARSGQRLPVIDPATGLGIASVAEAGDADIDDAVTAARRAHASRIWSGLPVSPGVAEAVVHVLEDSFDEPPEESIEEHEIERIAEPRFDARHSVTDRHDVGTVTRQQIDDAVTEAGFVFDHEDAHPVSVPHAPPLHVRRT